MKFISTLFLFIFFGFSAQAALTKDQVYFSATIQSYNSNKSIPAWLEKMQSQLSADEFKILKDDLKNLTEKDFLTIVKKDSTSFEFRDRNGKALATMSINSEGELALNGHVLTLKDRRGVADKLSYLRRLLDKKTTLWNILFPKAQAVQSVTALEMSILKFEQDFRSGITKLYVETVAGRDGKSLLGLVEGLNVDRLDHQCSNGLTEPNYFGTTYEDDTNRIATTKVFGVEKLAVRSFKTYRYDQALDKMTSEEVNVVVKPSGNLMLGVNKPPAGVQNYKVDVWKDGELVKKDIPVTEFIDQSKVLKSPDKLMRQVGSILSCCGDTGDKSQFAKTSDQSCVTRNAMELSRRGADYKKIRTGVR